MRIKDVEFKSVQIVRSLCKDARSKGRESCREQLQNERRVVRERRERN